jgi:hypothetical protein
MIDSSLLYLHIYYYYQYTAYIAFTNTRAQLGLLQAIDRGRRNTIYTVKFIYLHSILYDLFYNP